MSENKDKDSVIIVEKIQGVSYYLVGSDGKSYRVSKEEFMANEIGKPLKLEAKGVGYK